MSVPGQSLVQCGWCPVIMIHDMTVVLLHFAEDHGVANGDYSLRYDVKGTDWDVSELGPDGGEPG